jgi:hypothetical protein
MESNILISQVYNISVNKRGGYYRVHEIFVDCNIPNIQIGDVISSINQVVINNMSLEELNQIFQLPGNIIQFVNYRTALDRDRRARHRVHGQVILNNNIFNKKLCQILYIEIGTILEHTLPIWLRIFAFVYIL